MKSGPVPLQRQERNVAGLMPRNSDASNSFSRREAIVCSQTMERILSPISQEMGVRDHDQKSLLSQSARIR